MGVIFDNEFKIYGNEIAFFKALIGYIKELDSRIDCLNDPDEEYDVTTKGGSYAPEFNFTVNNKNVFTIKRSAGMTTATRNLTMTSYVSNYVSATNNQIDMTVNDNTSYTYDQTRNIGVYISSIISTSLILITIAGHGDNRGFTSRNVSSLYTNSGANHYGCAFAGIDYINKGMFNFSDKEFYSFDRAVSGTFLSRFSYKQVPGKIDYIKSTIYVTSLNQKVFDLNSILDCTQVTVGDTVSLNDGVYLAVGTNQLVKIS